MGNWRFFFFEGILLTILGLLAIIFPLVGSLSIELLLGALLVAGGAIQGYRLFSVPRIQGSSIAFLGSLAALIAGLLLLIYPMAGVITLTLVMAIFFLLDGIIKIVLSLEYRKLLNWGWVLVSGLLSIALAVLIWAGWPLSAVWVVGLYFGIYMLFLGISMVILSQEIRKQEPEE